VSLKWFENEKIKELINSNDYRISKSFFISQFMEEWYMITEREKIRLREIYKKYNVNRKGNLLLTDFEMIIKESKLKIPSEEIPTLFIKVHNIKTIGNRRNIVI